MPRRDWSSMLSQAEPRVFCLRSDEVAAYWPDFAHHVERFSCETGEITPAVLFDDLQAARKQLWGIHDGEKVSGIAVTEVAPPVCWIWAACGTAGPGHIERVLEQIEAWAKSLGCERLKLRGRIGWERRLPQFKRTGVVLEKMLC
jgi:hypothetical protein